MLSAADQLERILIAFLVSGARLIDAPLLQVDEDGDWDVSGRMRIALEYPGGQRLYVALDIEVSYGYPFWALYAFQFQDADGRTIFRYDNWPNHPEVETFPHHKHAGADERIEPHLQPSLAAIIREVQQHVRP